MNHACIQNKPSEVREVFNIAYETSLTKHKDLEAATLAGILAVNKYEKSRQPSKAIVPAKPVPSHVQAVIKAKREYDLQLKAEQELKEKQAAADLEKWNNQLASVDVDDQGRIVTTFNSGKKKYSKPLGDTTIVNKTVVVQAATDSSALTTEEEMYAKRVDFINDSLFYKGEAVPGSSESAGVWRISLVSLGVDGDMTETWASGNASFTKAWTDRLSYTYS